MGQVVIPRSQTQQGQPITKLETLISMIGVKLTLTHWGRVTHICVGKQTIIGSDNGLSPGRRQAIIYTNAGILLIGPLGTNFSEISIKSLTFSFTKIRLIVSSAKWRPFCLGLNGLNTYTQLDIQDWRGRKTAEVDTETNKMCIHCRLQLHW